MPIIFTCSQQESTSTKVGYRFLVYHLPRDCFLTYWLDITDRTVGLQGYRSKIFPCLVCHWLIDLLLQKTVVDTPLQAIAEKSSTRCLEITALSRSM